MATRRAQKPITIRSDKAAALLRSTYAKLSPWQKTLVARHPDRPHASDYIAALIEEFTPLAGDRAFADDAAVIGPGQVREDRVDDAAGLGRGGFGKSE